MKFLIKKLFRPQIAFSFLGPMYFSLLCFRMLSLYSPLKVRDQELYPYTATDKIVGLCILILTFWIVNQRKKVLNGWIACIPRIY